MISIDDLKFAWRLCRKARKRGKYRPAGSFEISAGPDTGYIYRYGGFVYIVIDGSDNFSEWVKNFEWFRIGKKRVAAGFSIAATEFANQAEFLLYDGEQIRGLGHSRGGGIIQPAILELAIRGHSIDRIITFGSPKIGGFRFCKLMKERSIQHIRIVAPNDPVPKLPLLRGRHYETDLVQFETRFDIFDFGMYRFVKGVIEHLSYGALLKKGRIKWT